MDMKLDTYRLKILAVITALMFVCGAVLFSVSGADAANAESGVLQLSTPTPTTQGQINLPTVTPSPVGGPTATPTRAPTNAPVIVRTVGDPETNLRSAPTLDPQTVIEPLPPGTELPVIGRWLGYDWYLVSWADAPNGEAWVYAALVVLIGDETTIPAVTPPPVATADETLVAQGETATAVMQTPGAAETATAQAMFAPTGVFTVTPSGGVGNFGAVAPTFTAPPPYNGPEGELVPQDNQPRGGIPPAVIIVSLGGMGLLTLLVGVIRRI